MGNIPLGEEDGPWGKEVLIDLSGCNNDLMNDIGKLEEFLPKLVKKINMVAVGKPIVKRFGSGKLEGISGFQFIETSNITVHLDEFENRAMIDIFSCKDFNSNVAVEFCKEFFKAEKAMYKNEYRGGYEDRNWKVL